MKKKLSIFGIGLALAVPCCCTTSCVEEQPAATEIEEVVAAEESQSDSTAIELTDSIPADTTTSEQE